MIHRLLFLSFLVCSLQACTMDKKTEETAEEETQTEENSVEETPAFDIGADDGADAARAQEIADVLTATLIADELEYLLPEQRTFQYAEADLNEDGSKEVLIQFRNSYFCGTGGCTYILMTAAGELITEFSVSDAPFYVLAEKSNGWHDLVIPQGGVYNRMVFNGKSYPSNPSVEPEVQLSDLVVIGELIQSPDGDEFTF